MDSGNCRNRRCVLPVWKGILRKIVLSEDIGVHKPFPEIFYFAMSATQSELHTSLMIGDNWKNDVEGAKKRRDGKCLL
ncbi:HAD-IA family hydrolase [Phocaeicola dorei]|uniref:HAD-IA family hydrolase n=1 Tax=Phocaeicola dorei TaxID=357276 RepID=UPI003003194A